MKNIIKQIPNFITTLNLLSGVIATIFAIDGHLIWAGIFICAAAVFDFADGLAARALKAYSEIGKQLDSLSDLVSFGVAPGAILFTLLEFSLFGKNQPIHEISADWWQWIILFSAFLVPVFGAIRLAKFNVITSDEPFFRGLPIPSSGIFWASLGLMLEFPKYHDNFQLLYSTKNLVILGIFMSGMMVINLPMFSLKVNNLRLKENWYRYLFLALSAVLLIVFNVYGLALVILLYIILNVIFYLFKVEF
ncbi:CDP-alcohol phosphatidyltransferase family protein [Draconibacterium halophilum]|uniref:CDP-diacylglycerol--serine O-phosphatidyltransferase n=1 Tax=Draconibacterium halophilum TaxID=2706887 RepID=A0A6C0RJI6_9BACT|nr:CDP-alcohol phosphatidyltransferase family protein [Draconibacterium halophilum]QIA09733.1 CDP-diacylglycerol--serine O-phosphatidyltransferase [Draconibacterium halophilum]